MAELAAAGGGSGDQLREKREYDGGGGRFGLGEVLLEGGEEGSFEGGGGLGGGGVTCWERGRKAGV